MGGVLIVNEYGWRESRDLDGGSRRPVAGWRRVYFPLLSFPRVDTRTVPMAMRICPNRGIGVSVLGWVNWNAVAEATGSKREEEVGRKGEQGCGYISRVRMRMRISVMWLGQMIMVVWVFEVRRSLEFYPADI